MTEAARPGDVLADRYRLVDLLSESGKGRFWRAHDNVLERHVALHCITGDDTRAAGLTEAARLSATVIDRRLLRVLDADERDGMSYVVNEWGSGTSLDILVNNEGPLSPRRAAWIVSEVAASMTVAHDQRVAHGRLVPENVLIDHTGAVRVIGCCVDAALRGLPPGQISSDVSDLGGLLYFALTGRWAGPSLSDMPAAPHDHGRWLRPRQVRAGIPRVLDGICDVVLNPYEAPPSSSGHNLLTAAGLADALRDYVGDPSGLVEAAPLGGVRGAGALAVPGRRPEPAARPEETQALTPAAAGPDAEELPDTDEQAEAPDLSEADTPPDGIEAPTLAVPMVPPAVVTPPVTTPPPAPPPTPADPSADPGDQPTQAGMPVFDDEGDEVSWFSARPEPPPPPPPLEEPPERPLFAPDPSDGGPARRPRPGASPTGQPEYWPWDTGTGAGTGSGVIPVSEESGEEEVPGRSWFRLGLILGATLLLVLLIVVVYNLGRGRTPLGAEPDPETPSTSQATEPPAPEDLEIVGARDFDPQGDPPFEENPDLVPLATDGDAETAWRTQTYFDQFGPGGLKTGIGLVLDLGSSQEVSEIELASLGSPLQVTYYLTDEDPTAVAGLDAVAQGTVRGNGLRSTLEEPVEGQYVVVWLTSLAPADGDFRGEIAEVVVRGMIPADERDDAALLAAHVAGDTEAFGVLFSRHRDRLWAVALRTMGTPDDAADGLQDGLIAAYRRAGSFRGDAAVTTWLHRVVVNACLDRLRAAKVRRAEALPEDLDERGDRGSLITSTPSDPGDPGAAAEVAERRSMVLAALRQLPAEQRAALVLVDMEGYPVAEAAQMLDCAVGTVKSRCSRGRSRLAQLLGALGPAGDPAHDAPGNPTEGPAVPSPDARGPPDPA